MATHRPLDLTVISAKDLKDVNFLSKMEVYAVAWLSTHPAARQRTPTDRDGGKNPSWNNAVLRFFVPDGADTSHLVLHVLLRSERSLGDRDVGEVHVPVRELESAAGKSDKFVTYEVRRPSGKPKGLLNFSVKFGDPIAASAPAPAPASYPAPYPVSAPYPASAPAGSKGDEPVTAYPAGPSAGYPPPGAAAPPYPPQGYPVYPPPPQAYGGYGAPPPGAGYGYPPQPGYGYGAPPVAPAQPPKKSKFGMGLGAGLLGGALGGLLIGDMISDANSYDAGYDAGFDDGGGFDF